MAIPNARRRTPLAALHLHLAVVGAFNTVTAQVPPPPPQLQLLSATTGRTAVPTTVITIAAIVFFVLVLFCVLVNKWHSSSADADASAGGRQGSISWRRRGLDPTAVSALPVVPYAEIKKHHKSGGGGLECAVCLAAFSDGDELRLLPHCSHAFHPDCIDPWLEDHVTCPQCRVNLEKPVMPPPAVSLSSPESETKPPETLEAALTVRVVEVENDDGRREEETVELEKLRAARTMPRSRSVGHSTTTVAAETGDDRERFTVRLPPHVLEEVLMSRRLRHATSLVIRIGGGASNCEGGSACAVRGERCPGARRRWPSLLARTTTSWSQSVAEGSAPRGGVGVGPDAGTRKPPCGHVVCSTAARWPARCKARNLD